MLKKKVTMKMNDIIVETIDYQIMNEHGMSQLLKQAFFFEIEFEFEQMAMYQIEHFQQQVYLLIHLNIILNF